jgi:acyl carrier protein
MTVSSDVDLRQQIVDQMHTLLPQVLDSELPGMSEETRLMEDLGLTSSTTLELMLGIEEELEIQINVEDIEQDDVGTVGALATFIAGHLLTDDE